MGDVRLGLIGENIAASQAPRLHALAGALYGIGIRYDLLVPSEVDLEFDALFESCQRTEPTAESTSRIRTRRERRGESKSGTRWYVPWAR